MTEQESPLQARFLLNPVYWFTWLGLGLLYLSIFLPFRWMLALGTGLGWLTYILLPARRRITRTNIRLAFPELNKKQVNQLVKRSFYSAAIAAFESALGWWASDAKLKRLYRVEGEENLREAEALGKGVLLLGGHYTTVEISGRFLSYVTDKVHPTYKPAHNPLFEIIMRNSRSRVHQGMVASHDMRSILKLIKQKQTVWYASDQDFGPDRSVFAPFMGVQTATLDMSARLAKRAGAPVVPYYSERLQGSQGYIIRFGPMLKDFPSGDVVADATAVNAVIEDQVRRTPAQYLWGHRRFKTCPRGTPQRYHLRRDTQLKLYTLAHVLLSLPVLIYTAWIAIKNKQADYFTERVGLVKPKQADILFHAASIGEVRAIAPLINLFLKQQPDTTILLTVNTPSGMATAKNLFKDNIKYGFMPIDWKWATIRFLDSVAPKCVLITETEIWFNLFEYCHFKGIKNIIINARLSERSIKVPYTIRRWLSQSLQYTFAVLARSEEDAQRYITLSANSDYVKTIGNIKYSIELNKDIEPIQLKRNYILLASSRDGEEKLICNALLQQADMPLLVIVPRHIHRLDDILSDLSDYKDSIAVRSRNEPITDKTKIYIADTFGELGQFISGADFVIMGGSFNPYGGQNIIEVASLNKAVIFGPHMENFAAEAREFIESSAGVQVSDVSALAKQINEFIEDPAKSEKFGRNGFELVKRNSDMAERYYHEITRLCS